jgi:hypothetical protein
MNWGGCPPNLQSINLDGNEITSINWEGCPPLLKTSDLSCNEITSINWEGCPPNLQSIYLYCNKITTMNWGGCPPNLRFIYLHGNKITTMNWEDCRNEFIEHFGYDERFFKEYLEHKKSPSFIPYLPLVCKNKKELYYEIVHKLSTPPNGFLFLEDLQEMKDLGFVV